MFVCAKHQYVLIPSKVPLARGDVGIWNAIFSPPSPGGPMDVIVKARAAQELIYAIVCV
jgi:hypothetical protein